jgi:acetoin utilization deacetylase AcuC-like enzyme
MRVFYSPAYVARATAFATTRKAAAVARLVERASRLQLTAPEPASEEQIALAHSQPYINALRTGWPQDRAQSDGFEWSEQTWPSLTASCGGVLAASREALAGRSAASLSSGLHHARASKGRGFCAINGLAVAAIDALADPSLAGPVLILDLDAHGSGGTQSIVHARTGIIIADVITAPFDVTEPGPRCHRRNVREARGYLDAVEGALEWASKQRPGLVLYNAGVDVHARNDIGGLQGIESDMIADREAMVASWLGAMDLPAAGVLAGGYPSPLIDEAEIAELHMLMIHALEGADRARRPISQ